MDRKTLKEEYKNRKITGGVFRVVNAKNDRFLLDYAPDIHAKQNAFNFMTGQGSCFDYRLKKDWDVFSGKVFSFEVLSTLEKKSEQAQESFINDLQALLRLWAEKLDASLRY
jgi:hypothetical protein